MISAAAYRTAEWLERRLPHGWTVPLAVAMARLAFAIRVPARRALERNLAAAIPEGEPIAAAARRAFEPVARAFVEFLALERMSSGGLAEAVEVRGREHLDAAVASKRGVILLSAHFGNWEWGAAALAAHGVPLHLAARRHGSRTVEAMYERRRRAFGLARLPGQPLWPRAARVLREQGWLAVMGDRSTPEARRPVCVWAAALARRTGALLLPALTVRTEDGRYALIVEPELTPEACARGAFQEFLMRQLARHPGQWCAFEAAPGAPA
ncbi:MAG: lysophospholipid acyltransferase family protein [Candidatus Eiseniibacteriota bacterium]